ncbi:type II toxin-antitoxin system HicB family antitoxin [Prescottella subtropica]|uniref:type II toxin-antitoxin system HicB family antitoxin n=1 Tax=Prescottella subtropica TaxID=2545757 RepID=UPI0010F9C0F8|nr:type II toxin-antitoxin system HicB family antitoxin [Prescottella subtropica]
MTTTADQYTYRVEWHEPDNEYVGTVAEFPGLSWLAPTQTEALDGIRTTVTEVLDDMTGTGEPIPQPLGTRAFSGKFQVRISPTLHHKLARNAAEEGISLNAYISEKLAAS